MIEAKVDFGKCMIELHGSTDVIISEYLLLGHHITQAFAKRDEGLARKFEEFIGISAIDHWFTKGEVPVYEVQ